MSKIFDALTKSGGGGADIVRQVMGESFTSPQEASQAVRDAMGETAAERAGSSSNAPAPVEMRVYSVHATKTHPVLLFDHAHMRAAEQYRMIRTKIVQHPSQPRLITFTSGSPGDGKTFNSINTAGILSLRDGIRVLLVDGDLRRSSIAQSLGIPSSPGLGDILAGRVSIRDAMVRVQEFPNLYVIPAGEVSRPTELLDSPGWKDCCDIFRRHFRFTVVDAPPVAAVADYDLIQAQTDSVVVVVRQDVTHRASCNKALQSVPQEKLLGVIMNSAQEWFLAKSTGYYHYYGGSYDYYGSKKK